MKFFSIELYPAIFLVAVGWAGAVHAAGPVSATIYRCTQNGITVYSDIACSGLDGATKVEVRAANGYTPAVVANQTRKAAAPAKIARRTPAVNDDVRRNKCQSLQRSLDQVHSKMRAGYRVREGERLRDREAQLDERLRQERCH